MTIVPAPIADLRQPAHESSVPAHRRAGLTRLSMAARHASRPLARAFDTFVMRGQLGPTDASSYGRRTGARV